MFYQLSKMLQRRMERLERDSADKKKNNKKNYRKSEGKNHGPLDLGSTSKFCSCQRTLKLAIISLNYKTLKNKLVQKYSKTRNSPQLKMDS